MKVRKSNSESKIVLLPNLWKYVCKSIKIYKRGGEIVAEDQSKVFEAAQENMKKTVETDAMLISNAQQRVQVYRRIISGILERVSEKNTR